ncbi:hypothetical protein Nepgr_024993 [Nepenthes gracilis]|uniref:Uncharacterized protein n=1 Tax=Nepenthes gracilis TaxID=150966 RepID=A0AAD3T491_NEPGR|nr:hypothetical protein Nepgr_024993 [Nepenthes gracilis]
MAFGALKRLAGGRIPAGAGQWDLQITFNFRLILPSLKQSQLKSNLHIEFHVYLERSIGLLAVVIGNCIGAERYCSLAGECRWAQIGGVLVLLVEGAQRCRSEKLVLVVSPRLYLVVVDADVAVRVPDGEVDGEVEGECGIASGGRGEVELGERCVGGVEFDDVGTDDEPEDEDDESDGDEDGDDDLDDAGYGAAGAVTKAVQAAVARTASAGGDCPVAEWADMGCRRWWDWCAAVGPGHVRLVFSGH